MQKFRNVITRSTLVSSFQWQFREFERSWLLMSLFPTVFLTAFVLVTLLSFFFTFLSRLGKPGKRLSEWFICAPGLDFALSVMIWIPWVAGFVYGSWPGLGAVIVGQMVALQVWVFGHEQMHRSSLKEPRIVGYLNQRFGWWRNHMALLVTSVVLPVFFLIRLAQFTLYPCLMILLNFRAYKHGEWINVSRQKFNGLVGHDLIWCLYCDWMTGVYSLGAEMLRNVESFWCPIRFYNGKKCENCQIDFPDVVNGWVPKDGRMSDVVDVLDKNMPKGKPWSWLGDPDRKRSDDEKD